MDIINNDISQYLHSLIPARDPILEEMEQIGKEKGFPIIGPLVGRLLCQLAMLTQAARIFELGSGYGYSAIWFSKGMPPGGQIICTDGARENAQQAATFFARAGIQNSVDFRIGDALSLLEREVGPFDIILNDIDKHEYPRAFKTALPKLRKGGLLVTDNTLWYGKVVTGDKEPTTMGILEFNRLAYQSTEMFTTLIPLRDGVTVSMKL